MRALRSGAIRELERYARWQNGVFTRRDALRHGVPSSMLAYHCSTGRWRRVLPGVYAINGFASERTQLFQAAVLWGGPQAAMSHRAAAALLGLDGFEKPGPEVRAPKRSAPAGVILHRGVVSPEDRDMHYWIQHTSVHRTLVDLAGLREVDIDTLEIVVESVLRAAVPEDQLWDLTHPKLTKVLRRRGRGTPCTASEAETLFAQLIRRTGLPAPLRQHQLYDSRGGELARPDFFWPDAGLVVEIDSRQWHSGDEQVRHDMTRHNRVPHRTLHYWTRDLTVWANRTAREVETAYHECLREKA